MKTILIATAIVSLAAVARADSAADWTKHCARCHAADGTGKTKIGEKLGLKDYTTAEGQKFSDDEALDAILKGIKDDAGKARMPSYSEKLSPDEAKALVAFVRTLKK